MLSAVQVTAGVGRDEFALLAADTGAGKAGPLGLFVILLLAVAVFFLVRSMTRHLKKIPPSFDPPPSDSTPPK